MNVLIVDDEPAILDIVEAYLTIQNYQVSRALTGAEALEKFANSQPDLVILDLMLPDRSGTEICQLIRQESTIPIIMLTAKSSEKDVVTGLRAGADDYVVKPFSPKELVARVEAVMRRAGTNEKTRIWRFNDGELEIHPDSRQVFLHQEEVELTAMEYDLLALLAAHPQQVFTREQLLEQAKGLEYAGMDRVVDSHIKNLRHKLGDNPKEPKYILTVYGTGYRFGGKK